MRRTYRETFRGILPAIIGGIGRGLWNCRCFYCSFRVDRAVIVKGHCGLCTSTIAAAWFIGMNCYEKNLVLFPGQAAS